MLQVAGHRIGLLSTGNILSSRSDVPPMGPTQRSTLSNASFPELLNSLVQRVASRAEMADPARLQRTFVEIEQITTALRSIDHGVVYGRRGTGKTHAFTHLSRELDDDGQLTLLIDLRRIGSNGGLYSDSNEAFSLRASQLLIDVLEEIHGRLLTVAFEFDQFSGIIDHLDALAEAATQVRVDGSVERSQEAELERASDAEQKVELSAKTKDGLSASAGASRKASRKARMKQTEKRTGNELPQLRFGQLSRCFERICESIRPSRLWILLDEWSSLPLDLQPILADMVKRVFFACPGLTVKIGAIERRSLFVQRKSASSYVGLELGADTGATLNLDEHLVGPDDHDSAVAFYERVIQKHLLITFEEFGAEWPMTIAQLRSNMFEGDAFSWLVRAAEGIPRDAINVLGLAAGHAGKRKIRAADIQKAARTYYLQDKEKGIIGNQVAGEVWDALQREVVFQQRSRTFLVRRTREQMDPALLDLYDARLIHLLKPGLVSPSAPGSVYDGYAVDYGCYVNVLREMEMDAAWQAAGRPWAFSGDDAFLPDRFDSSVIFQCSTTIRSDTKQRKGR